MRRLILLMGLAAVPWTGGIPAVGAQTAEKELIMSISGAALDRGVVSEILWDGGSLIVQSVAAESDGRLSARYYTVAGPGLELRRLASVSEAALKYWEKKASRVSPTGLGRISSRSDAKMPMYGVGSLEKRLLDAQDMGGTDVSHDLLLGNLVLHSRKQDVQPYDGEVWSWSPAELNRIAYVDGKGDLWIARADGARPERVARGSFTLPAWSEDGRSLAIVERKENGARWDVLVLHLPPKFRD
jgi:hypothetical protein